MICNLLMLAACWNINFQLRTEAFAMLVNVMWTALPTVWHSGSTCLKLTGNRLTSVSLLRFHNFFQKKKLSELLFPVNVVYVETPCSKLVKLLQALVKDL